MKDIFEIVIHGRGGQGAKTAAQLIVEAALLKGKHIQAFPEYGPERSGAPMRTFARISDKEIKTYQPVTEPDAVLVIDPTLLESVDVSKGAKENSILIVNSGKEANEIKKKTGFRGKVYSIDATKISIETLGVNRPNTPIIGAFAKITNIIDLDTLISRVENMFLKKLGEEKTRANIKCLKRAYEEVKL